MKPSIIILTFNSSGSIQETLASIRDLSDDVHVLDSGSTDNTVDIATAFGANVLHHPFRNYGDQRNWAIDNTATKYPWQLHLDADEKVDDRLRAEILQLPDDPPCDGYFIKRYIRFMGRTLMHNLAPTWHMRLFRATKGRCELREYDQHFLCSGTTSRLNGSMLDDIRMSLSEWTYRHNRWADAEVREALSRASAGRIEQKLTGNVVERKRYFRGYYDRAPLFVRAFGLFFYRYFIRLGFLDGMEGLIFCVLQGFWFRFLVDAKLYEARKNGQATREP